MGVCRGVAISIPAWNCRLPDENGLFLHPKNEVTRISSRPSTGHLGNSIPLASNPVPQIMSKTMIDHTPLFR